MEAAAHTALQQIGAAADGKRCKQHQPKGNRPVQEDVESAVPARMKAEHSRLGLRRPISGRMYEHWR